MSAAPSSAAPKACCHANKAAAAANNNKIFGLPAQTLYTAAAATAALALGASAAYKYYQSRRKAHSKVSPANVTSLDLIPTIDLGDFLNRQNGSARWESDCKKISELLHEYGILIIKDPRVAEVENENFINLLERYYEQPESVRSSDVRKEVFYQVGVTPSGIEKARDHCARIAQLEPNEKPLTICPPERDPKSRFFWRMGERPEKTEFPGLNAAPVIPSAFPEWEKVMNRWGDLMLQSVHTVVEMAAVGFGFPVDQFTKMMKFGPHLLAPTASDLATDGAQGTVFANYHYDLNFITIHGRSRFPGLFVWTRHGKKIQVKVPPNCLLLQAGKQFEWLTGGEVLAGFHEVVVVQDTLAAVERAKKEGRSLWRISSTLFGHIASDQTLQPLGKFSNADTLKKYPPTKAGVQVQQELELIKLAAN
jgi:isopenicillin N synthase-like dioxygenase